MIINTKRLIMLQECWPEAIGYLDLGVEGLEGCLHEMAHVLDITGDVVHHGRTTLAIIYDEKHGVAADYNEIRASAVTRQALIALGLLDDGVEDSIVHNMRMNCDYFGLDARLSVWGRMRDSRRSKAMGRKLAATVIAWGVVE